MMASTTRNLGRRLEAASPLLFQTNRISLLLGTVSSNNTIHRAFPRNGIIRRISSLPIEKTRPQFATGGFFTLGASSVSSITIGTRTRTTSLEKIICNRAFLNDNKAPLSCYLVQGPWKRSFHTSRGSPQEGKDSKEHSVPNSEFSSLDDTKQTQASNTLNSTAKDLPQERPVASPNKSHLMNRLPNMPHLHRPSKEELLAAANGFWSRLKVRFKWFSIRSVRPFNFDELAALFSWVLLGHIVWVVVGTTTFFSLVIFAINTVLAQGGTTKRLKAMTLGCIVDFAC